MNDRCSETPRTASLAFEDVMLPAAEVCDDPAAAYTICLVLQGEARLSYRRDDRWHTEWLRPGMFAPITRPHAAATLHLSEVQRHLMITVSETAFERVAADAGDRLGQLGTLHEHAFTDPFLGGLCRRAWSETRRGDRLGQAFAGSIESTLICGLLRSASGSRRRTQQVPRWKLSPGAVAAVRDHCLGRLDQRITVAELAALVGMESHAFARAFKAAVGQPPQQYLIALRTQAAREMLRDTPLPIPAIALACGFFDQSHLTSTFTRLVGTSPSRFRRQSGR